VKTIEKSEVAANCERVNIRRDFDEPREAAGLRD
jgi:hypothetical protein